MDTGQQRQQAKELTYRVGMKKGKIRLDADGKAVRSGKSPSNRRKRRNYAKRAQAPLAKSIYTKLVQPAPFISARRLAAWPLIGAAALAIAALYGWLIVSLAAVASGGS